MKKINLEFSWKWNCFGYWNSCKHLANFVNMAVLLGPMNLMSPWDLTIKTVLI